MHFKLSLISLLLLGCSPNNEEIKNQATKKEDEINLHKIANAINKIFEYQSLTYHVKPVFHQTDCTVISYEYWEKKDIINQQHQIQTEINLNNANFKYHGAWDEDTPFSFLVTCNKSNCLTSTNTPHHPNYDRNWKYNLEELLLTVGSKNTANELQALINAYINMCKSKEIENRELIKLLLSNKDNIDVRLLKAVAYDDIKEAENLLKNGANINYENDSGEGLLHIAYRNYSMTKFLLENGINVNQKNYRGNTVLHRSVTNDSEGLKFSKLYISYSADPNIKNIDNQSAMDFARLHRNAASNYLLGKYNTGNSKLVRKWTTDDVNNYEFSCTNGKSVYIRAESHSMDIINYTNGYGYTSTDINKAVSNACKN